LHSFFLLALFLNGHHPPLHGGFIRNSLVVVSLAAILWWSKGVRMVGIDPD
jgi:hypothetical protein